MSTKIIFHVGMPKTATTLLQRHLFMQHPEITGYTAIQVSTDSAVQDLFRTIMESNRLDFVRNCAQFVAPLLLNARGRSIVISHERMCMGSNIKSHPYFVGNNYVAPEDIAERLFALAPNAKILITIRSQPQLLTSFFAQIARGRSYEGDFEQFLESIWDSRMFSSPLISFDYMRIFNIYARQFGEQSIHVVPFEWLQLDACRFFDGIGAAVGLSGKGIETYLGGKSENARKKVKVLDGFKSLLNATQPLKEVQRAGYYIRHRSSLHPKMNGEWKERIREHFSDSNLAISEKIGIDLGELDYM